MAGRTGLCGRRRRAAWPSWSRNVFPARREPIATGRRHRRQGRRWSWRRGAPHSRARGHEPRNCQSRSSVTRALAPMERGKQAPWRGSGHPRTRHMRAHDEPCGPANASVVDRPLSCCGAAACCSRASLGLGVGGKQQLDGQVAHRDRERRAEGGERGDEREDSDAGADGERQGDVRALTGHPPASGSSPDTFRGGASSAGDSPSERIAAAGLAAIRVPAQSMASAGNGMWFRSIRFTTAQTVASSGASKPWCGYSGAKPAARSIAFCSHSARSR